MVKKNCKRTGIWIPVELMNNEKLDWTNKVLMSEIMNLSKLENGCIASNEHFAQILGIERSAVSKRITFLEKVGMIMTNKIYERKRCVGRVIQLRTLKPEVRDCDSDKNHPESISTAGCGSTNELGIVPADTHSISKKDEKVVPEGIDSGSQGKPINTLNKKEKNILENIPESSSDTSRDTGEDSIFSSSLSSFSSSPVKPVDEVELELAALSRQEQKVYLNMLFEGYPNWETDMYKCADLSTFLKRNEKYYVYDDDSEATHWNYCLIKVFYGR